MKLRLGLLAALAATAVSMACPAAYAQGVAVQPPATPPGAERQAPRLPSSSVTLADAVRLTVLNNPQIRLSGETLGLVSGRFQETRGIFDSQLHVGSGLEYMEQQLSPFLRKAEKDKRDIIASLAEEFTVLTTAIRGIVASLNTAPPRCPRFLTLFFAGFSFQSPFLQRPVTLDRVDPNEITLLGTNQFLAGTALGDILGGFTLSNFCTNPNITTLSPEVYFDIFRELSDRIDQSGGQGLQGILRSVSQIPRESRALQAEITNAVATRARLALERLGPIPVDLMQRNWSFDAGLLKPFRTGMFVSGDFQFRMQDQNFRGKSYDSSFGGMGNTPQFLSSVSGTLTLPVGRGSGRRSVGAPERSAALIVTGQRETRRHQVSEEVYRTMLAYFNLIAAQETLTSLEESADRQRRMTELTEQAVQAGDLAGVETARARARAERVNTAVSDARASLVAARVSLADTMGVGADDVSGTPLAADTFARQLSGAASADELAARALASRLDVRAASANRAAADELAAGASGNLRPRFDFSLTGGLSNIYSSPIYKYLPDELNPIIPAPPTPPENPIHYYSPAGLYRAARGRWEPFALAELTIELPFGNNFAKGRLLQAQAALSSSRIESEDLTRKVRANVVDVADQLVHVGRSLEQWEAAARSDIEVLQGALQRFESRDLALIDTLLTEESVTRNRLELVRQRQIYYSTLARLKFETGELVSFPSQIEGIEGYQFDPSVFVAR